MPQPRGAAKVRVWKALSSFLGQPRARPGLVHDDRVVPVVDPEQEVAHDLLPRHAVLSQPNASYFCLKLGNGWSAEAYTRAAEEAWVGVTLLSLFAASSLHPSDAVRVCVNAAPDQEVLRGPLETLAGLLEAGAPPSVRFRAAV